MKIEKYSISKKNEIELPQNRCQKFQLNINFNISSNSDSKEIIFLQTNVYSLHHKMLLFFFFLPVQCDFLFFDIDPDSWHFTLFQIPYISAYNTHF